MEREREMEMKGKIPSGRQAGIRMQKNFYTATCSSSSSLAKEEQQQCTAAHSYTLQQILLSHSQHQHQNIQLESISSFSSSNPTNQSTNIPTQLLPPLYPMRQKPLRQIIIHIEMLFFFGDAFRGGFVVWVVFDHFWSG
mmetsp:Transcript_8574/g.31704  ORF Transcript_8574/g.31704 Transcript_8574/m.31704 type:complete len:139 (-) Transcript_8574:89-505(-)